MMISYKIIWAKIEDLKNIELDALQVYNDRYIKTKIRTYGDKVYNNFGCFNVPEDVECVLESLLLILYIFMKLNTTYKLVVRHTKFLYEIVDKQLIVSLDGNLFEMDKVDKAIHLLQDSVLHNLEYISSACQRNQYQK